MKYWLCITIPQNWEKVKENGVWGVEDRYEITLKRLTLDDIFVFYVTKKKGIAGIYTVSSEGYYDETPIGWDKLYPCRVKIDPLIVPTNPVPLDEKLIEELLFITDKSKRGRTVFFFPSMVLIPEEDYRTIVSWLEEKV